MILMEEFVPINNTEDNYPKIKGFSIGICDYSGSAELSINKYWSTLLSVSKFKYHNYGECTNPPYNPGSLEIKNIGKISLESRKYFDNDLCTKRGFMSLRVGTSKNIGAALGMCYTEKGDTNIGLTAHIGVYMNIINPKVLQPTMGINIYFNNY